MFLFLYTICILANLLKVPEILGISSTVGKSAALVPYYSLSPAAATFFLVWILCYDTTTTITTEAIPKDNNSPTIYGVDTSWTYITKCLGIAFFLLFAHFKTPVHNFLTGRSRRDEENDYHQYLILPFMWPLGFFGHGYEAVRTFTSGMDWRNLGFWGKFHGYSMIALACYYLWGALRVTWDLKYPPPRAGDLPLPATAATGTTSIATASTLNSTATGTSKTIFQQSQTASPPRPVAAFTGVIVTGTSQMSRPRKKLTKRPKNTSSAPTGSPAQ